MRSSAGTFSLFGSTGRRDKQVKAHKGAVTALKWNLDGETRMHCATDCNEKKHRLLNHLGCLQVGRSAPAGTAILTAGEDGQVKTWSGSGVLRSTLATCSCPVYSAAWGPDSFAVLYSTGKELNIAPVQSGSQKLAWQAHDAVILKVDWSAVNDQIISGGEDCRYKVSLACIAASVRHSFWQALNKATIHMLSLACIAASVRHSFW